ncbi:MAG: glycosyltransferase family 4 protein [Elusimicrobia bacterium]|nr:glycosyltransferase family 4 protein [Elusimicrobiota bacterium]
MENKINSVLMISQTFYPVLGGAEKQAFELSKALVEKGVNVTVITRRTGALAAREIIDGVKIKRFKTFGSGALDSCVFMTRVFFYMLLNRAAYGAAHVHLASSPAVAAVLAGRLTGKKTVVKLGGGRGVDEITLSRKTFLGRLKLRFFSLARPELLVMNGGVYEWLKNSREFRGLKLRQFRNGVDTGKYTPPLYHEKISAKAAVGFENDVMFLFVGRLSPEKRVKEFIEVWAELFAEELARPKIRLVIVGSGPEEENLKTAISKLEVGQSVTLTGPKDDLLPYYRAADVFVLPSISEGLSNSMLEAMSCGAAIMASRVGGAIDAVVDGESGCLFDPLNRQEIKQCLRRHIADRSLSVKMGGRARLTAVEKYSMARVADELIEIYGGG